MPPAPSDAFMAGGYLGQYVVVVPSQSLVRFGLSYGRGGDVDSVGRRVSDIIDALAHVPVRRFAPSRSQILCGLPQTRPWRGP